MRLSRMFLLAFLSGALTAAAHAANDRPLLFGMNPIPASWWGEPDSWNDLEYQKIAAAGGSVIRVGMGWDLIEPTRGVRDWSAIDQDINRALDNNLDVVLLPVATPTWALPLGVPSSQTPFYPPREEYAPDFESFIYEAARRFRGRVRYWEFWNEPNGSGWHTDGGYNRADEYTPWLIRCHKTVRLGDPASKVAIGGLDDNAGGGDYFVSLVYLYGGRGYFDAVADHPYSQNQLEGWKLTSLRQLLDSYGDTGVDIWITEYGYASYGRDINLLAGYLTNYFDQLTSDLQSTVKIGTWHTAADFPWEDVGFGLMDRYLNPRATYNAFKNYPKPARPSISNIVVSNITPTSAVVTYSTNMPARGLVMYGPNKNYGSVTARETSLTTTHSAALVGLAPGTTYHYRIRVGAVEDGDSFSSNRSFATPSGAAVQITSGPTVSAVTTTGATISWTTNVPATSRVEWGPDYGYGSNWYDAGLVTSHSFTLADLSPNSPYQFRVTSTAAGYADAVKEGKAFRTLAPSLVQNQSFDAGLSPWVKYGQCDGLLCYSITGGILPRTGNCCIGSSSAGTTKTGGCYQQVPVTAGQLYRVTAWTIACRSGGSAGDNYSRIGLDPTGGTNPASSNVVWGDTMYPTAWTRTGAAAVAQSSTITIFLDIVQTRANAASVNCWDDVEFGIVPAIDLGNQCSLANGSDVGVLGVLVSAKMPDHFYVQKPDRSAGIRVNGTTSFAVGDRVNVTGILAHAGYQRAIGPLSVSRAGASAAVSPLVIRLRDLGGAPDPLCYTVLSGAGAHNVGLLVRAAGRVTAAPYSYRFYLDDGSMTCSENGGGDLICSPLMESGYRGVRIALPSGVSAPGVGSRVLVTGVSFITQVGEIGYRAIKPRDASDVVVF